LFIFIRRKDVEIEFALYRYGYAYRTGFSDCIYVWQTTPAFKVKRKYYSGGLIVADSVTPDR
jgi:hypothetical protein